MVSMLTRMLVRELWALRGQVLAAALVAACGIAALVATRATYQSLLLAQADFYAANRFADVFARLKRAPESLVADIRRIDGVAQLRTRIVTEVTLDVPGLPEPAVGRLVSIPERQAPMLNDVQLVRGHYLAPGSTNQVLVSQAFADANGLDVGDRIGAVLNGRWRELEIAGLALSPEYIYELGSGMLFPDNRRFGVLWMAREVLGPAFNMEGAFNDLTLSLTASAREQEVIAALDRLLKPYGGLSAHGRSDQLSHRFLSDELTEIGIMTAFIPGLFLAVAAFLLYVVLSRLVASRRTEIGLLKAFGRSDLRVGSHYLLLAVATVTVGLLLGLPSGVLLGRLFVEVYRNYFHFPDLHLHITPSLPLTAAAVAMGAAAVGALAAVRRAVALAPAQAMHPEAPASFRAGLMEWGGLTRRLPSSLRMIARNLARKPWKAAFSVLGIALAVGLMVVGRFGLDGANHMMAVQFNHVQRDDVTVLFAEPRAARAALELARLAGVMRVEPFRSVPVWLRHENHAKRVELTGLSRPHELRQLLDSRLQAVELPRQGLLLSSKLAEILDVRPGDSVSMEVLEGARGSYQLPVLGLVDELLGLGAYVDARTLSQLLLEDEQVSGAHLSVQSDAAAPLFQQLKRMPAVSGVAVRQVMQSSLKDTLDRSFAIFSMILAGFASVIVGGMVYNSLRIALSERSNELASLCVLGFTQREVSVLLLGEQALLTALAIPLGLAIGYGLCAMLVPAFDREMFRLPLVLSRWSFIYPVLVTLLAAGATSLLVAHRLRHLDLIAVLKTRE